MSPQMQNKNYRIEILSITQGQVQTKSDCTRALGFIMDFVKLDHMTIFPFCRFVLN
jgi:hypothetical protein